MPFVYVKQDGAWKTVQRIWVKNGGVWVSPTAGLITQAGIGKQFYPDSVGPSVYSTAGTYTYTVPPGVTSVSIASTGGGGAGQVSYFDGGNWTQIAGAAGSSSTVTNGTWTITSNGGGGGSSGGTGGTVTITGASSTTLNQTGGSKSGGTGGSSYYGAGTAQGGNSSKPATPPSGAGGGAGFQLDGPANYGGSGGGTGIAVFAVTPGQTINITVGAGATGQNVNYNKGGSYGSYAGNGGSGFVKITPLNANIITYNSPGIYTFTVPAGITSVTLSGSGGGGGGGCGDGGSNYQGAGGGGGGSNIITSNYSVTPTQSLSITVGAAGAGGVFGGTYVGQPGGSSTVTGTGVSFTAGGGAGGTNGSNAGTGFGGIGANGANYTSSFRVNAGGTSNNGGSNGGIGGNGNSAPGFAGQNGKLTITY